MKRTTILFLLILFSTSAFAQNGFSTIEERMTGKEFTAAGLDKLSEEELAALNEWLRMHSVATLENASQPTEDTRGFESKAIAEMDSGEIVSRIKGPFRGWDGETVFVLENGMIWKQNEKDRFYIAEVMNPVVHIERGMLRTWKLQVEGYNKKVKVERLQ